MDAPTFPTIVYRSPGRFPGTPVDGMSTSYDCLGVSGASEHAAALADGWSASLVESITAKSVDLPPATIVVDEVVEAAENDEPSNAPVVVVDEVVDLKTLEIDDLKALAKDLDGYDGRLGKDRLIALIEKARG
jgi:hypothetical protein